MTELIDQPASQFVGRVYTAESSDQMGTFYPAWQDFEGAGYFDQLDALCEQPNRTYLVVFSPYGNFQYWIGSLTPVGVDAPAGLEAVPLPAGTVGKAEDPVNGVLNQLPVQTTVGKGFEMLEKAGFTIPAHIGQTDNPYYLESYPVVDGQVSEVHYLLYINKDQMEGYDEFD
ncbi:MULTISPECIES: hypothetical protein [unclassified Lacticaseibacillus]|uniref:hypothetical protein n=1 Tax=unclassified Lacticaseibacillus TaxID=2759744 RepID=UPI001941BC72|nr:MULTISPECIES: hypothetical protein [unclassified Lacticaseibacillus]